ncbi:MAG: tannase/feruloyl esterase family alpha/beta hydrolase [Acetobacteraceae bacterium]
MRGSGFRVITTLLRRSLAPEQLGCSWRTAARLRTPYAPTRTAQIGRASTAGRLWRPRRDCTAAQTPCCDAIDGVKDGLIDDPRKCDFDAHRDVPTCAAGADTAQCLTKAEADTVMKIYRGPVSRASRYSPATCG